jgi:hypothetical protein
MMKRLFVVVAAALTACGASPPPEDAPPPPPPIFALVATQPLTTTGHYLRVYRHLRTGECFVVTAPSTHQSGASVTHAPRSVCEG